MLVSYRPSSLAWLWYFFSYLVFISICNASSYSKVKSKTMHRVMSTHHVMQTMGVRMPSTSLYSTTVNVQSTWITKPTKQQSPRTVDDFDEDEEETLIQPYAGQFMNTSIHRGFGVSLESSPSLVLNADYTPLSLLPLSLWHWHDTLRAVWNGKAVVVAEYPNILVRSVTTSFSLPSVIALKKYHRKPDGEIATMNRRNLYVRDGFQCQYCLNIFTADKLSMDHVIPKAMGGQLTWTNTVCACKTCNFKKSHLTVTEISKVGMKLRRQPHAPTIAEIQMKSRPFHRGYYAYPDWRTFI